MNHRSFSRDAIIPELKNYDLSGERGFLPRENPLTRLSSSYFESWELILDDLSHLLIAGQLRCRVNQLVELNVDLLEDRKNEYERAFLVLALISHAYIWGSKGEPVLDVLPRCISVPWIKVSCYLRIRPVTCHAAVVLWNWRCLDMSQGLQLNNLATLHTISGGIDESWFYLITVAIEAAGAPALPSMLLCLKALCDDCVEDAILHLTHVVECMRTIYDILGRMYEHCDAYIFYHRIRIYFAGWQNMRDLPDGLLYEGDEGQLDVLESREKGWPSHSSGMEVLRKKYAGGSAAQSAMIQSLDVFFGIGHEATEDVSLKISESEDRQECQVKEEFLQSPKRRAPSEKEPFSVPSPQIQKNHDLSTPPSHHVNFLSEMRWHMPGLHRDFLNDLGRAPSLRGYICSYQDTTSIQLLVERYNEGVYQMKLFRDRHLQIVSLYVVIQARKAGILTTPSQQKTDSSHPSTTLQPAGMILPDAPALSTQKISGQAAADRGTGGTSVLPFLKQARNETSHCFMSVH